MTKPKPNPRLALMACPTYAGKEYALDAWLSGYESQTYPNKALFTVDNTAVSLAYLKTLQEKGIPAIHYQPFLDKPWEHTFHACWELILKHAQEIDAYFVFAVEADNVPAPEALMKLVTIAEYAHLHVVTQDYPIHQKAAAASGMKGDEYWYAEFGCMLLTRSLLEAALAEFDEYRSVAQSIWQVNAKHRGGYARLTHSFEVAHLDGFEYEYYQGFAGDPTSEAICPVPFMPHDTGTVLPPSLEGHAEIVHEARPLKLNLGSGGVRVPGYVSVDFDEALKPHVLADVEDLTVFEDDSVEAIYASHILEHLPLDSPALAEWMRVLKPGGVIAVIVPDLVAVYELSRHGGTWGAGEPMDLTYVNASVFGANLLGREEYAGPGHQHKQVFIEDMLAERLRAAGFVDVAEVAECEVRRANPGETMVTGRKPAETKETDK